MSTSLEVSHAAGLVTGEPFNDYNTVSNGKQRISKIALYVTGGEVVGIKTTYSAPAAEKSHGQVAGTPASEFPLTDDQYIIAGFVATLAAINRIGSVFFNVANTQGEVDKRGLPLPPGSHTVERAYGNIIAFHGTTKGFAIPLNAGISCSGCNINVCWELLGKDWIM
ncbi:hypothetical protein V8E55_005334 [Tylopilus felleus]